MHMRCEIVGDPPPTKIRWFKNEEPVVEEPGRIIIKKINPQVNTKMSKNEFIMINLQRYYFNGSFVCTQNHEHVAKNIAGSRLKITRLDVNDRGFYSCRANNAKDLIQSEGILQVRTQRHGM